MKYIIKESQILKYLLTELELPKGIVFWYLEMQELIQIDGDTSDNADNGKIFFVMTEGDTFAEITYFKNENWCYISESLVREISSHFRLSFWDSRDAISKWVADKLGVSFQKVSIGGWPLKMSILTQ